MQRHRWLLWLLLLAPPPAMAQLEPPPPAAALQEPAEKPNKLSLQGYVKELHTFLPVRGLDSTLTDHLVHSRLNFRYQADSSLAVVAELRSRLFYGDLLRQLPAYPQLIDAGNDVWDLSWMPLQSRSLLLHTMLDRAYLEYNRQHLELRLGRQRINWGLNLVWNPNDLFNTFSYFDFDYEERPGSDALRIRYFRSFAGGLELAARLTTDPARRTAAALWHFNRDQFDWQLLAGLYQRGAVAGGGWAGNLGEAGFKGELTWFLPSRHAEQEKGQVLFSVSADYSFASSLYLHASALYNNRGSSQPGAPLLQAFSPGRLEVRNLSPYRYSLFGQTSYPFHPLLTGSLAAMYFPEDQAFLLNPVLTYSALPNLDLDVLSQLFFDPGGGDFSPVSKLLFLRLKWSF